MHDDLKIRKLSMADQVCDRIRTLLLDGTWPVGTKLPAEAQLADRFGVNRLTVRIALQKFNALGILETRDGEGTFVRTFAFDDLMNAVSDFYVSDALLERVGEFRRVVETACADLTIARGEEADLSALTDACRGFEESVAAYRPGMSGAERERLLEHTVDRSLDVHLAICRLSGNPLFAMSFEIAKSAVRKHMVDHARHRLDDLDENGRNVWVAAHWALCRAIEQKDPKAFRTHLEALLSGESPSADAARNI